MLRAVIDTNVIISGLQSNAGRSYELLQKLYEDAFIPVVSVPLVLEYEEVITRRLVPGVFSKRDVDTFLDYFCTVSDRIKIHYLWRPTLKDPFDDHVLELTIAAGCNYIVTYNLKDFKGAERFGVKALRPSDFIHLLEEET